MAKGQPSMVASNKSKKGKRERQVSLHPLYYTQLPIPGNSNVTRSIPMLDTEPNTNTRLCCFHDCIKLWGDIQKQTLTTPKDISPVVFVIVNSIFYLQWGYWWLLFIQLTYAFNINDQFIYHLCKIILSL